MNDCWAQDPDDRPSFLLLCDFLKERIDEEKTHFRVEDLENENTKEVRKKMNAGEKRKHIIANRRKMQARQKRKKSPVDSKIARNKRNSESKTGVRMNWLRKEDEHIFEPLRISEIIDIKS